MRDGFHSFNTPEYCHWIKRWEEIFGAKKLQRSEYYNPLPKHYQVKEIEHGRISRSKSPREA